jgi:hypothetical protein
LAKNVSPEALRLPFFRSVNWRCIWRTRPVTAALAPSSEVFTVTEEIFVIGSSLRKSSPHETNAGVISATARPPIIYLFFILYICFICVGFRNEL